jgi:uncharacterized protein (DUF779 family)
MTIELTVAQARALAELADREGPISLHQLGAGSDARGPDVYATPVGATVGFRIAIDGAVSGIGETLPATDR